MRIRISKPYTAKLIEGQTSGYGEVRLYPCCNRSHRRNRSYQRSIQALQNAYNKRSAHTCYVEAVENFGNHDYFLTITFSPGTDDKERMELLKKIIRYLQRRCKANGETLKYIYNWGRGEKDNQLHSHMFLNNVVSYNDLIVCCNTYKNVNIDIQYIDYSPYKVLWKEQTGSMSAVVVGSYLESIPNADPTLFSEDKPIVVDSKVLMLDVYDEMEAYYVCGIINSNSVTNVIDGYAISTNRGVDVLKYVAIPLFDRSNSLHVGIAKKSKEIHIAAKNAITANSISTLEKDLDTLVIKLFS